MRNHLLQQGRFIPAVVVGKTDPSTVCMPQTKIAGSRQVGIRESQMGQTQTTLSRGIQQGQQALILVLVDYQHLEIPEVLREQRIEQVPELPLPTVGAQHQRQGANTHPATPPEAGCLRARQSA